MSLLARPLRGGSGYNRTFLRAYARTCLVLGRKPSKRELMERLGMSRNAINLVLRRLQGMGFELSFPFNEEVGCTVVRLECDRRLLGGWSNASVLRRVLVK